MRPCLFSYFDAANIGSLRRRLNHDELSSFFFLVHLSTTYAPESWVLPPRQHRCLDFACPRCGRSVWASGIAACINKKYPTSCKIPLSSSVIVFSASFYVSYSLSPKDYTTAGNTQDQAQSKSPTATQATPPPPLLKYRLEAEEETSGWKWISTTTKALSSSPSSALDFIVPTSPCKCPETPAWSMG